MNMGIGTLPPACLRVKASFRTLIEGLGKRSSAQDRAQYLVSIIRQRPNPVRPALVELKLKTAEILEVLYKDQPDQQAEFLVAVVDQYFGTPRKQARPDFILNVIGRLYPFDVALRGELTVNAAKLLYPGDSSAQKAAIVNFGSVLFPADPGSRGLFIGSVAVLIFPDAPAAQNSVAVAAAREYFPSRRDQQAAFLLAAAERFYPASHEARIDYISRMMEVVEPRDPALRGVFLAAVISSLFPTLDLQAEFVAGAIKRMYPNYMVIRGVTDAFLAAFAGDFQAKVRQHL